MAKSRFAEIKVGLLVVLAIFLLVTLTVSISDFTAQWKDTIKIYVKVPSIVGLEPYSKVTYSGVKIGVIVSAEYDESLEMAILCAEIERNSPVALNSNARFTSASLLSPLFLEISGGSKDQRIKTLLNFGTLKPSEKIYLAGQPSASIVDLLGLAANIKPVLATLQHTLDSVAGLVDNVSNELTGIMQDASQLLKQTQPRVLSLMDTADGFINNASGEAIPTLQNVRITTDSLKKNLPKTIDSVEHKVSTALTDADGFIRSASPEMIITVRTLRESLEQLRNQAGSIEKRLSAVLDNTNGVVVNNKDEIERIMIRLEKISANLDDMSGQLAKNPWRLLWKTEAKKDPKRVSPDWDPFEDITKQ